MVRLAFLRVCERQSETCWGFFLLCVSLTHSREGERLQRFFPFPSRSLSFWRRPLLQSLFLSHTQALVCVTGSHSQLPLSLTQEIKMDEIENDLSSGFSSSCSPSPHHTYSLSHTHSHASQLLCMPLSLTRHKRIRTQSLVFRLRRLPSAFYLSLSHALQLRRPAMTLFHMHSRTHICHFDVLRQDSWRLHPFTHSARAHLYSCTAAHTQTSRVVVMH